MRITLATLFLVAAVPAAHAKVEIRDVQAAHGLLGPERSDTEYLPGDEVFLRFTVTGARTTEQGRLNGEIKLTLTDAAGQTILRDASPVQNTLAFGGDRFPAKAAVELGHQFPPGEYQMTVEFKDLISGESDSFTKKFTCRPIEFGLARVRFAADEAGRSAARVDGVVGQPLHLKVVAVGFDRSAGAIDLEMEVRVLDAKGRPVAPEPVRATVRTADPETVKAATHATFSGELTRTRPGEFRLQVTITDRKSGKTTTFETPMRVTD
ncbi:MAG: hypothetical protein J2P46_22930 [Zavarzinella sp.]|nr:hypothetical protein [Zavarzinella sp.]